MNPDFGDYRWLSCSLWGYFASWFVRDNSIHWVCLFIFSMGYGWHQNQWLSLSFSDVIKRSSRIELLNAIDLIGQLVQLLMNHSCDFPDLDPIFDVDFPGLHDDSTHVLRRSQGENLANLLPDRKAGWCSPRPRMRSLGMSGILAEWIIQMRYPLVNWHSYWKLLFLVFCSWITH